MLGFLGRKPALGQVVEGDNPYYQTFPDHLTARFYLSQKYTSLLFEDEKEGQRYLFAPNTTLNHGIGATYKWATLNLAYGFEALNPDLGQGDTRYLDLQAHAYPKTFVLDFFGQFYKGYHLAPQGLGAPPDERFYVDPEMRLTKIGVFWQYLFNSDKFSFRAAFLNNEWQKRSAGSFLAGFELYGGRAISDSLLLPATIMLDPSRNFRTLRFLEIGPNVGYAYTLVIKKHFFITGALSTNLGFGYSQHEGNQDRNTEWGVRPNVFLRGFAGYNSEKWSINANYVHNRVRLVGNQQFANDVMTGNYRVNFVYRFLPGPQLKRYLDVVDFTD
jgi:hypothetical protein